MSQPLLGRRPHVEPDALIGALAPPPHFAEATFDSYLPDPAHPSQEQALAAVARFAAPHLRRLRPRRGPGVGLYLDGGFGVGKTHLLAALAHAVGRRAAFGTFVEYTSLVGVLGFAAARDALSRFAVVCIDEFELDDPGDTLIMARLMRELTDAGVCVAATSNTLPGALGEGRFAAADFQREIQAVARVFDTVRIDGPDYRHRESLEMPPPADASLLAEVAALPGGHEVAWDALVADIAQVHPSRYGAYVDGVTGLAVHDVGPLTDQNQALRVVALVDRLYDRDVRIAAGGAPLTAIFTDDMMRGGYRKKYLRALSRLESMVYAALEHARPA